MGSFVNKSDLFVGVVVLWLLSPLNMLAIHFVPKSTSLPAYGINGGSTHVCSVSVSHGSVNAHGPCGESGHQQHPKECHTDKQFHSRRICGVVSRFVHQCWFHGLPDDLVYSGVHCSPCVLSPQVMFSNLLHFCSTKLSIATTAISIVCIKQKRPSATPTKD